MPTVTSVTPNGGSTIGGTPVQIAGTGFAGNPVVTFGGAPASNVNRNGSTQITCNTPPNAPGPVNVTVAAASLANGFNYLSPPPTVQSVSPSSGSGGTAVVIHGSGFIGAPTVRFGAAAAAGVVVVNSATINCTVPAGPASGPVNVQVTNPNGQAGLLTAGFTYTSAPTVQMVSPPGGPIVGGTSITIGGAGFLRGAIVTLGGAAASNIAVGGGTTITCTSPPHIAGLVNVVVTNPDAQLGTLANGFNYTGVPTVVNVSPVSGTPLGGTPVTVTGTNYSPGATVTFGLTAATNVVVQNPTTITCLTPPHAEGAVRVTVTNPDGQSGLLDAGFSYTSNSPIVQAVNPLHGPITGGTTVTISGSEFQNGATVTFGGTPATNVAVLSDTSLTCITPAHAAGAVDVVVRNLDGKQGTLGAGYVYDGQPAVTNVNPTGGPTTGGPSISIGGSGFQSGATVTFGGTIAGAVTVQIDSTLTCVAPPHAAGAVNVIVTNPDGQSGTLVNGYTYA